MIDQLLNESQLDFMAKRMMELPETGHIPKLIDWAEEKRFLPSGTTELPGQFSRKTAPPLVEPLEMLHPDCDKTHVAVKKSVQSMFTTSVGENALGFWIDYQLGSVLFLTSTKGIANVRSSSAIDVLIDNAKLKIKPMSDRMKRKTGDKANYKEFAGNIKLLMSSYNSIADLKSNTFHLIVCDEWDEAGAELAGQGDIAGIIEGRTLGLRRFKVLQISTPSDMKTSRIHKAYMEGDQRQYHVPCPLCGEMQPLELKGSGKKYGLTFNREPNKNGKKMLVPETVRYICKHCKDSFQHSKKQWMLENGVWVPYATPDDNKKVSYHSPGLISSALSWERICQQYINCDFGADILKFKDFTINYMGNAWATTQKTPKWQEVMDNSEEDFTMTEVPIGEKRNYDGFMIPHQPLLLYAGCDVQKDRLEVMVVGFGVDKEKWAYIDYKVFSGDTGNVDSPCWLALDDFIYNHSYEIVGQDVNIMRCGIDSGYDPRAAKREKDYNSKASIVYDFVYPRSDKFVAVMGITKEASLGLIKEAKINDVRTNLTKRTNIYVSIFKDMIFNIIEQTSGVGTIHFPKYHMIEDMKKPMIIERFKRFLSERYQEDEKGNWKWVKIHERNEDLDCFIYACAMAEYDGVLNWSYDIWNDYYEGLIS